MERKNSKKSVFESKLFKIPIEEYEKDMNTESAKGKKNKILDLFNNYNKLHSEEEFKEIEYNLHNLCKEGDAELIKIYLSETVENNSNTLQFKIDETNRTASLFKVIDYVEEVIIPRTIEHESVEYLITSINGTCDCIQTLKFVEDSAVKTIYEYAFSISLIQEIYFPASLKELKEGWCCNAQNLTKITISPFNGQFKIEEEKILLGKSDSNKDEFDILLFGCRDIKEISIPSNIRIISSYAFEHCINLTKVEIPTNSNLQSIGKYAFLCSCIKEIYFPSSLKELKEGWCCNTKKLTKITISPSNGQFKIEEDKLLLGKSDSSKNEFDILLFAIRNINEISIPSNIKIISSYAFQFCENLTKIEIPKNSNLQTIEKDAFSHAEIEEIFIPSKISKICENAFYDCFNLTKVEIPANSNLQIIESNVFKYSKIKEIFIPSKVSEICENTFYDCENLTKVEIPMNSNLQIIESNAFKYSKIKEIFIPSKVSKICERAFSCCIDLRKVEISTNSSLQSIESYAFAYSKIKEIFIPSKVSKIGECAFKCCPNLAKVEIPANSNLQIIESNAFTYSKIKEIFIPSKVSKICEKAFYNCIFLQIIEISEESKLESFPSSAFSKNSKLIIMIPTSLKKLIHTIKPI